MNYIPYYNEKVRIKKGLPYYGGLSHSGFVTRFTSTDLPYISKNSQREHHFYLQPTAGECSGRSFYTDFKNVEPWSVEESIQFRLDYLEDIKKKVYEEIEYLKSNFK